MSLVSGRRKLAPLLAYHISIAISKQNEDSHELNKIIADIALPMTWLSRPSTHFLTDRPVGRHSLGHRIRKGHSLQRASVKIRQVVRDGEGGGWKAERG